MSAVLRIVISGYVQVQWVGPAPLRLRFRFRSCARLQRYCEPRAEWGPWAYANRFGYDGECVLQEFFGDLQSGYDTFSAMDLACRNCSK